MARFTFCLFMLATTSVSAQENLAEAREAIAVGERQFEAAEFPLALESFRRALQLVARPSIRLNIALCLERMGRYREATEEYTAALQDPTLPSSQVERANELKRLARRQLGTIVVHGIPDGTRVRIEGGAACVLPCELEADPGMLTLVVDVEPEHREVVELARGERREVPIQWTPPPEAPSETEVEEPRIGWMGLVGLGLTSVSTAGVVGFGLRSNALHDDYFESPTRETKRDGERARNLANASIGLMVAGAVALVVDLIVRAIRD